MSEPFFIIEPVPVDDTNFVSSTVPENDFPEFDPATTYNLGDRVIVTTGYHLVYESLENNNLGKFPPDNPLSWVEVGPTNRWALFDQSGGTVTTGNSPLEFSVTGDRATSLGLFELQANSVRVRAFNAIEGTYYDKTYILEDKAIVEDWFAYFFAKIDQQSELIVTDIPPVSDSTYTITLESGGEVKVGTFVMGQFETFGFAEYGVRVGIIDYSRKEVDQFGRATFVQRGFAKRMDVTIWLDRSATDAVQRRLAQLRATPVIWVGANEQYESMTVYGIYRDFSVDIAYPTKSLCTLQIEGLTQ